MSLSLSVSESAAGDLWRTLESEVKVCLVQGDVGVEEDVAHIVAVAKERLGDLSLSSQSRF